MSGATSSISSTTRSTDAACRDLPPREGVNQTFIPLRCSPSALMGSALSKEKLMKSSMPMPASLRRSATAASTLVSREQVDVPRGTRVDGSGKHALTALQDKGRIRVAEDAAQQPVEVEAGDGAVGV